VPSCLQFIAGQRIGEITPFFLYLGSVSIRQGEYFVLPVMVTSTKKKNTIWATSRDAVSSSLTELNAVMKTVFLHVEPILRQDFLHSWFKGDEKSPPVPTVQEAGWAPEPVWTQRLEGDRTPAVQSVTSQYTDWSTRLMTVYGLQFKTTVFFDGTVVSSFMKPVSRNSCSLCMTHLRCRNSVKL
jgi:hypothetical protein